MGKHENTPSIILAKYLPSMIRGKDECYSDLSKYLDELEATGKISNNGRALISSYPNKEL